jgi:hypothetical protein
MQQIEKNATFGKAETMHRYEIASTIDRLSQSDILLGNIKAYDQLIGIKLNISPYFLSNGKICIDVALSTVPFDSYEEPWAKLSCTLDCVKMNELKDYEFFVKTWSENTSWVGQMLQFPQIEDTGKEFDHAFWRGCPIWRINPDKICPEPFHNHHDGCPLQEECPA